MKSQFAKRKIVQRAINARIAASNVFEDLELEKRKLEIAQTREEAILLSMGDGLLATDQKGKILVINRVAEELLHIQSKTVLGKSLFEVLIIVDERKVPIALQKHPVRLALQAGVTTKTIASGLSYYYIRSDKTYFPVAMIVTPTKLNGKVIGAIVVFRDITQEKAIDKVKTEFVSLASHQLRTPLATISWYAEMLLDGDAGKLNRQQKRYLQELYHGNKRMVVLIDTMLNASRLELGTIMIEPELTNIITLAQNVMNELKFFIHKKKLILKQNYSTGLPLFNVDPKLLHMVFQNIFVNAINYTPDKGIISLHIYLGKRGKLIAQQILTADSLVITLTDTGYGIPQKQRKQIFTKFFRADNVRTKNTEGTGLGLYIVKSIIDHLEGMVWFESIENRGTTFFVTLPIIKMKKARHNKLLSR